MIRIPRFDLKVPAWNSPLAAQELQIGGTNRNAQC